MLATLLDLGLQLGVRLVELPESLQHPRQLARNGSLDRHLVNGLVVILNRTESIQLHTLTPFLVTDDRRTLQHQLVQII